MSMVRNALPALIAARIASTCSTSTGTLMNASLYRYHMQYNQCNWTRALTIHLGQYRRGVHVRRCPIVEQRLAPMSVKLEAEPVGRGCTQVHPERGGRRANLADTRCVAVFGAYFHCGWSHGRSHLRRAGTSGWAGVWTQEPQLRAAEKLRSATAPPASTVDRTLRATGGEGASCVHDW
jgi:hypothetical protein